MSAPGPAACAAFAVGLAPDLKQRVEIMAEHVSKNGPEFENTVRSKNAQNPQFQFLVGGEGSEYYQALLQSHPGQSQAAATRAVQGAAVPEPTISSPSEVAALMGRWPTPEVTPLSPDAERQLAEILNSLERVSSREAISHGRTWVQANVAMAPAIASNMMKRVAFLSSSLHRLHVLYLVHEIFVSELARQDGARPLISAFKPCLVWMVRPTFQIARSSMPDSEGCAKIKKLLAMWLDKGVLTIRETEEITALMTASDLPAPPPQAGRLMQQVGAQMGVSFSPAQSSGLVGSILGALQQVPQHMPQQLPNQQGMQPQPGFQNFPLQAAQQMQHAQAVPQQMPPPMLQQHMAPIPGHIPKPPAPLPAPSPALAPEAALRPVQQGQGGQGPPGMQLALASGSLALSGQNSETPESVPVGVMSSMLKQVSRRGKDLHAAFVPYRPLDPFYTPQTLPLTSPPSGRLLDRLAQFYRVVGDSAKVPERSRSPQRAGGAAVPPPPLD